MFFTDPDIIDNFFKESRKGQKTVEKTYKKAEIIDIAKNLGVSDLKGTKAILVGRIFKRIGPGTEASLRNDLVVNKQEEKIDTGDNPIKTYTKPYDVCTLEELKEEADTEGMLSTGSRDDIIDRLEALDSGKGQWEDCTTEFMREELIKNGYISTGDRHILIARMQECDDHFIGPAENKTTVWLKKYLESNRRLSTGNRQDLIERVKRIQNVLYPIIADFEDEYIKEQLVSIGESTNGTRKDWLLRIYPFEISELFKICNKMKHDLSKPPRVKYQTKYRNKTSKKTSVLGHIANGVALGAGLSLGAKIFGRRMKEESNLKF